MPQLTSHRWSLGAVSWPSWNFLSPLAPARSQPDLDPAGDAPGEHDRPVRPTAGQIAGRSAVVSFQSG